MRIRIYAGQYFDEESGLHYNYHRYYDPKTGRYLTPDPIGLEGGINLYIYVHNNPINWFDPFGLSEASFDRATGKLRVYDKHGILIGEFNAGNYTTNPEGDPFTVGSEGPAPFGFWPVQPPVSTEGRPEFGKRFWPIGERGPNYERLDLARKRGIGLHSGRRGPKSPTQGCVRISESDSDIIFEATKDDPLTKITIWGR